MIGRKVIKPCPKCGRDKPIHDSCCGKHWFWCPMCCHHSTPVSDLDCAIEDWNSANIEGGAK